MDFPWTSQSAYTAFACPKDLDRARRLSTFLHSTACVPVDALPKMDGHTWTVYWGFLSQIWHWSRPARSRPPLHWETLPSEVPWSTIDLHLAGLQWLPRARALEHPTAWHRLPGTNRRLRPSLTQVSLRCFGTWFRVDIGQQESDPLGSRVGPALGLWESGPPQRIVE